MSQPAVLFLCTGNSARSQIAEAFLRHYGGDRYQAHSAGLEPKGIHPFTIQVMAEVGIDLGAQRSKSVEEFFGKLFARYVVMVCANVERNCPRIWPFGGEILSWPFDDPAAAAGTDDQRLDAFRTVRDAIEAKILDWLKHSPT